MKLLFFLMLLICEISCSQHKEVVNIYSASDDSIFYCAGEKFEPQNLIKGTTKDSIFISTLIKMISDTNKTILFKPLAGNSAGSAETMINMIGIFQKNKVFNFTYALADSTEIKYFDRTSLLDFKPSLPPEVLTVKTPTSVSSTIPAGKPVLFFLINKENKLYYKYDSIGLDKNFIQIKPITTQKIIQVISELERINKITFNQDNVLIKGDGTALYPFFKKLKDALKAKEIFKFRIVTTTE